MLLEFSKTYKPFLYPWAVELVKKHEEIHWTEDEAELSEDIQDWRTKLTEEEKEFIREYSKHIIINQLMEECVKVDGDKKYLKMKVRALKTQ